MEVQSIITDPSFTAADLKAGRRALDAAHAVMHSAVVGARAEGWSWERIGTVLGVSGETVRRRHAPAGVDDLEA
uniref:Uncharacterized protein n=1 Tax=uncultured prokaryote TaxID=198431 RepID=A0A0H5Q5D4_9ZZZZ|nr:hypothetical protein [uncultured prokaryote]